MRLDTALSSGHLYYRQAASPPAAASPHDDDDTTIAGEEEQRQQHPFWSTAPGKRLPLGVRKRHSSPLVIQFRQARRLRVVERTTTAAAAAYAVLWLSALPDDEEQTVALDVWKGDRKRASTCRLPPGGGGRREGRPDFATGAVPPEGRPGARGARPPRPARRPRPRGR